MDMKTRSRLEAVLNAHEQEIEREQDRIDEAHMAEVLFAQRFVALKGNVVVPAFQELEAELRPHGHLCKTVELDELYPENGKAGGKAGGKVGGKGGGDSVRCEFYPRGWHCGAGAPLAGPPAITLTCDPKGKTVKLHECTFGPVEQGWSGELGTFALEEITRELIAECLVGMVEKILLDRSFIARTTQHLQPTWSRPGRRAA